MNDAVTEISLHGMHFYQVSSGCDCLLTGEEARAGGKDICEILSENRVMAERAIERARRTRQNTRRSDSGGGTDTYESSVLHELEFRPQAANADLTWATQHRHAV